MGGGDKQTDTQTNRHINTMTRPGLGAEPSEKFAHLFPQLCINEREMTGVQPEFTTCTLLVPLSQSKFVPSRQQNSNNCNYQYLNN